MPFFSRKKKDGKNAKKLAEQVARQHEIPQKPRYASNWDSAEVVLEEVEDLLRACTKEMKSRAAALDTPFLLLPFRPEGNVTSARTFIRNYFKANKEGSTEYRGEPLRKELRLTEPEVLCSIVKWCWSRIPGGVVSWSVYQNFRAGEQESGMAINSFDTFIPLAVESETRQNIIYDFFDLISAIAAHGKANGMGGRKLSRMAGWWAFEQAGTARGFDGGYKSWAEAADASSHLFFAYLRSRAPEAVNGIAGISKLPRSLQALVGQTEYPPEPPALMQSTTSKVLMLVDAVSPTPFSLLRRARLFEYRADDKALNRFAQYNDPVDALTEECKRVLESISPTNQRSGARTRKATLATSHLPGGLSNAIVTDESWSRFQDEGFVLPPVDSAMHSPQTKSPVPNRESPPYGYANMQARAQSRLTLGARPTTPSWADFLNTGFVEDGRSKSTPALILRPDQKLPPISDNSGSLDGSLEDDDGLEPGELASITRFELDDAFWWVWMTSLSSEETPTRKAAFGRCALVETSIQEGRWLLLEEQVKGASPAPEVGAYIAEKKSIFSFSRRNRSGRKKVDNKAPTEPQEPAVEPTLSTIAKENITPDQKAKISEAAAELIRNNSGRTAVRRGRFDDGMPAKTNSIMTLGLTREASPAMLWASAYDREAMRKHYLGDNFADNSSVDRSSHASSTHEQGKENENPAVEVKPATPDKPSDRSKPLPDPGAVKRGLYEKALPASLPPQPSLVNVQAPESQAQLETAVAVPLPKSSPTFEQSTSQTSRNGRKPLPEGAAQHVHPAFRGGATAAPAQGVDSGRPQSGGKKLQKRPTANPGFKKMFGRKRDDTKRASADLSGFSTPKEFAAQRSTNTRAFAKNGGNAQDDTAPEAAPTPHAEEAAPSEQEVQSDLKRFDQGPVDTPAFVPRDSLDTASIASPVMSPAVSTFQNGNKLLTPQVEAQRVFAKSQQALVTAESPDESQSTIDTVPEALPEEDAPAVLSPHDRWAQIKKNAAERAARQSEEQSTRSQRSRGQSGLTERTDDGETSGEETIEERVARIKARVAHLTGKPQTA